MTDLVQSNIPFKCRLRPIWLQSLGAISSESCQRSIPSFCESPSEVWADALSQTGCWLKPRVAALHRIWFGKSWCGFAHMPYFHLETNEQSKGWAKRWAQLCWATSPREGRQQYHCTWEKTRHQWLAKVQNLQSINTFWLWLSSQVTIASGSTFSSSKPVAACSNTPDSGTSCVQRFVSSVQPAQAVWISISHFKNL